jgi:hypothetical protein
MPVASVPDMVTDSASVTVLINILKVRDFPAPGAADNFTRNKLSVPAVGMI